MRTRRSAFASIIAITIAVSGCAQVRVDRVIDENQPGIRYWRPAPYLSLAPTTANGATTCEAKLMMLPDKSEEYAITMSAGMGTAEMSPTLQDGWNLTALTGKADSKTAENITAIASLVKSLAPAGLVALDKGPVKARTVMQNCSGFYRLNFNKNGELESFKPIPLPAAILVTTTPPPAPKDPKKCGVPGQQPCTQ